MFEEGFETVNPISPHPLADEGLSAARGAATNSSGDNQQIKHRQLGHQADNQRSIARQDPRNTISRSLSVTPLASEGPISPRDHQLPHLVSRASLLPHQSPPQPMYQNLAVINPVAPLTVAPSVGSQLMPLHPNQTHRFSKTNTSDPSRNGQQLSPYVTALQSGAQHPQHPSHIHHQSTPMPPSQGTSSNRKPVNASRLRSGEISANSSPTGPHSVLSNQPPQFYLPTSSVSRTSTIPSNHSSSSRNSSAPNLHPNSPDAPSALTAPYSLSTPYPFQVQSQGAIKRRPVPPPPTQPAAIRRVKAIHEFIPEQENELGFTVGDVLDVLNDLSQDGWWEARLNGKTGAIPANYVGDI